MITNNDLYYLADNFVAQFDNEDLPLSKDSLDFDIIQSYLDYHEVVLEEDQKEEFIECILSASENQYQQVKNDKILTFERSLENLISDNTDLPIEDLLKSIVKIIYSYFL